MSNLTINKIDTDTVENITREWFELTGTDSKTGMEFSGDVYALTSNNVILDCDGCPRCDSDNQTIAVRNLIAA